MLVTATELVLIVFPIYLKQDIGDAVYWKGKLSVTDTLAQNVLKDQQIQLMIVEMGEAQVVIVLVISNISFIFGYFLSN
jgi:hypothetical protein